MNNLLWPFEALYNLAFSCRHKRRGMPKPSLVRGKRGIFENCLDCGHDVPYTNVNPLPFSKPTRRRRQLVTS